MLTITVEHVGESVTLQCVGRIVLGEETALLCAVMQQKGRKVILDLTQVDAIDAAGIGALLSLQAAGIYLSLMNPTSQVLEVLRVTKMDSILEIYPSQFMGGRVDAIQAGMSDFMKIEGDRGDGISSLRR
jgi:anti-anti-sigma factor